MPRIFACAQAMFGAKLFSRSVTKYNLNLVSLDIDVPFQLNHQVIKARAPVQFLVNCIVHKTPVLKFSLEIEMAGPDEWDTHCFERIYLYRPLVQDLLLYFTHLEWTRNELFFGFNFD